jgi:hypothetical protein
MIALVDHRETTAANQPDGRRTIAELTKTVSASRLSTWQRCRLQFYFRYVAGIQKSPTPALHIGTTVHTVLQQWNIARWHGARLEVRELKEIFSRAWIVWQDGEQIDWEGNEEAVKSATWDLIQLYLRETPIAPDENRKRWRLEWKPICPVTDYLYLWALSILSAQAGELSILRLQPANRMWSCSRTLAKLKRPAMASSTGKLLAARKMGLRFIT